MTQKPTEKRGRPAIDDDVVLERVGERLLDDPSLTVRSAIMQSLDDKSDANIRRIQRKWMAL